MRAAFFDLDGCLVDSRAPISAAMNAALRQLDLPAREPAELYGYIGPPLLASFQQILRSLDADPELAEHAVTAYRNVYPDLALTTTRPIPAIPELLAELHDRLTVMVVTSKPVEYAEPILDTVGLRGHIKAVFGPALDALTERKTTSLERALRYAGVRDDDRRSAAVMIGDRRDDIVAGKECGIATIGVTWGIGDRTELTGARADAIVDHPQELSTHLGSPPTRKV